MMTMKSDSQDEYVAIVDENNRLIGSATRQQMRRKNLIHRATFILLFNGRGELFVQKRTQSKDVYPGFYEVAAGGVVGFGESYEEAARRELAEEVGISGCPLKSQFDFFWNDEGNRVWGRVFLCCHDGPFVLQESEVESGAFLPLDLVWKMARNGMPFTPDGIHCLDRYLSECLRENVAPGVLKIR
ncbi:MAG: NUDIX hydrolase YfcD [Thermodesulfobacteriota bacterium]